MKKLFVLLLLVFSVTATQAQDIPYSQRMSNTVLYQWKDSFAFPGKPARWSYDFGVILKGIENLWNAIGDP